MTLALVTAFGPFPGVPWNPSEAVLSRLPAGIGGASLVLQPLPTEYAAAGAILERVIATFEPDICLCLGVGSRREFRLESAARNHGTVSDPDNAGAVWTGPVAAGGPPRYESGLPLDALERVLRDRGHEVSVSDDAGGYLCNFVFYRVSHLVAAAGLPARCGFLHLPAPVPEPERTSQVERMTDAVTACLATLLCAEEGEAVAAIRARSAGAERAGADNLR